MSNYFENRRECVEGPTAATATSGRMVPSTRRSQRRPPLNTPTATRALSRFLPASVLERISVDLPAQDEGLRTPGISDRLLAYVDETLAAWQAASPDSFRYDGGLFQLRSNQANLDLGPPLRRLSALHRLFPRVFTGSPGNLRLSRQADAHAITISASERVNGTRNRTDEATNPLETQKAGVSLDGPRPTQARRQSPPEPALREPEGDTATATTSARAPNPRRSRLHSKQEASVPRAEQALARFLPAAVLTELSVDGPEQGAGLDSHGLSGQLLAHVNEILVAWQTASPDSFRSERGLFQLRSNQANLDLGPPFRRLSFLQRCFPRVFTGVPGNIRLARFANNGVQASTAAARLQKAASSSKGRRNAPSAVQTCHTSAAVRRPQLAATRAQRKPRHCMPAVNAPPPAEPLENRDGLTPPPRHSPH